MHDNLCDRCIILNHGRIAFDGSEMTLFFKYKINAEVRKAGIRVELLSDSDHPFATQVFENVIDGPAFFESNFIVNVDLTKVQNGNYQTYYTVFVLDPYDESVDLDCVRGLDFTIQRPHEQGKLKWRASSWGNVIL